MRQRMKKCLSLILCGVLFAAMTLSLAGCKDESESAIKAGEENVENFKVGETTNEFIFEVVDEEGNVTTFPIKTDASIVGDALLSYGLISGDEGEYGLYVKTVNGITADYETDGKYWAFYVNGEYAMSGVDATVIEPGVTYSFKIEK